MHAFRLTTWNVEWLVNAWDVATGAKPRASGLANQAAAQAKLNGIRDEVEEIDPDILLLIEALPDPADMRAFVAQVLPGYRLVCHPGDDRKAYATLGRQWLWFLVKPALIADRNAHLLDLATWQTYTGDIYRRSASRRQHRPGSWWVSVPTVDKETRLFGVHALQRHSHYRHPQVLVLDWDGQRVEFIGLHLKSKFTGTSVPRRGADESDEAYYGRADVCQYMAAATVARSKLSSEASDVRAYIDRRFEQEPLPAIFVLGDLNDGPGKELLEQEYMLHDLIGNLQGDVFFARRFLNHALFDLPQHLRWSVHFKDDLDPSRDPRILLDHILFTEALSRRGVGHLLVPPQAGLVEHEVHDRIASLMPPKVEISDHRPVSLTVALRPA